MLNNFRDINIVVYALPEHTSGKLEPGFVVIFSSLKREMNKAFAIVADTDTTQNVDVFKLCSIIRFALRKSFTRTNIILSFERCGLWPVNCTRVMSVPRPQDVNDVQNLASVDKMHELFLKKSHEAQRSILGENDVATRIGFVVTNTGLVPKTEVAMAAPKDSSNRRLMKRQKNREKRTSVDLMCRKRSMGNASSSSAHGIRTIQVFCTPIDASTEGNANAYS